MRKNNLLRLVVMVVLIFFIMPSLSPAQITSEQNEKAVTKIDSKIQQTITFSEDDFEFSTLLGYDIIELNDCSYINEPGKPMIPAKNIKIALPNGLKATNIKIINIVEKEMTGAYTIFPAQKPQMTDKTFDEVEFIEPDTQTYNSEDVFPSQIVEIGEQTDLAGQAIIPVKIYPLQYIPKQKSLTLITSIEFIIEGENGYVCGDYLSNKLSDREIKMYNNMVKEMVVNPEDVDLKSLDQPYKPQSVPPGDYRYVIITQDSWVGNFQPLANWKTKKGVPANIVTTSWIYSTYSGSNQQKIRSFIIDAHSNWGTIYFLLGGDSNIIPYYTRNIGGTNIPTDTYYADYDNDWTVEVHVGRAPVQVTGTWGISTFINKINTYEKSPPLSNYGKTAFFMGFDLYTWGSDEGEDCKVYIKNQYLPSGWTLRTEYDSEPGTHRTDSLNYLNQGNNLVNHIDHSGTDFMGTGYTNDGLGMDTNDARSRTNGNRQSIIYSIGCWPCDFPDSECIAEGFVRNPNGGGVAFVGNTRSGWYSPYSGDFYSLRYDRYFFRSLFNQGHYILGECFSDHKNDAYQNDDTYRFCFVELTLLGDPELPIWTDDPTLIDSVSFPNNINTGSQQFTVTVTDGGSPVNGALVCVQKGSEVYEYGTTNSQGKATFTINPVTTGSMDVTVTKHNLLPWEGTATVSSASFSYCVLLGMISNLNQGTPYSTFKASLMLYIKLSPFGLDVFSSGQTVTVHNSYTTGVLVPGLVAGVFYADV